MDLSRWKVFRSLDPVFTSSVKIALAVGCINPSGEQVAGIMVMRDDRVFSIGENLYGCLGVEGIEDAPLPVLIKELSGQRIRDLSNGWGHVIALTQAGRLFSWGDNKFRQLARLQGGKYWSATPELVGGELESRVVTSVACGYNHTVVITSDGEVFAWGYNKDGRIGCANSSLVIDTPTSIVFPSGASKIVSVAAGRHFSAALSETGEVFLWGSNLFGQLGSNTEWSSPVPGKLQTSVIFTSIACGACHCLALSRENICYFWGQTGAKAVKVPTRVSEGIDKVLEIGATFHVPLSVVRSQKGIYVWGSDCFGQSRELPFLTNFSSVDEAFAYSPSPPVMWRCLKSEHSPSGVTDSWLKAFENSDSCDMEFDVAGKSIPVHSMFLRARSEYFRVMLEGSWTESSGRVIKVEDRGYKVFRAFLRYLYSDQIDLYQIEDIIELMQMGDYYGEPDLLCRCEALLKNLISVENACNLYAVAVQTNAKTLEQSTFEFVTSSPTAVLNSTGFKEMPTELMADIIKGLARRNAVAQIELDRDIDQ